MSRKSTSLSQKRKTLLMGVVGGMILSWVINKVLVEMSASTSTKTETFSSSLVSLFFIPLIWGVPILTIFATGDFLLPVLGHIYRKYNVILAFILIAIILLLVFVVLYFMFIMYIFCHFLHKVQGNKAGPKCVGLTN